MRFQAGGDELLMVTFGQVDMPLLFLYTDGCHVETRLSEGLIDLVAHLKTVKMYAWANLGLEVTGVGAVGGLHICDGFLRDTCYGATPPGVDGANGVMSFVVEQNRDAVGSRYTYAHAA